MVAVVPEQYMKKCADLEAEQEEDEEEEETNEPQQEQQVPEAATALVDLPTEMEAETDVYDSPSSKNKHYIKSFTSPGFSISNSLAGDLFITAGDLILQ